MDELAFCPCCGREVKTVAVVCSECIKESEGH